MFETDGLERLCVVVRSDESWLYFYDIPIKRSNQTWVAADGGKKQLCCDQVSIVGSDCSPFFFSFLTHRVQSWLTFYHS